MTLMKEPMTEGTNKPMIEKRNKLMTTNWIKKLIK